MSSSTSSSERKTCLALLAAAIAFTMLAALAGGEAYLRARVIPQDFFWNHVDLFFASKNPDAAFGDSHMARGFTGTARYVNLAYPGATTEQVRTEVKTYYADKKPGRVILLASPRMLSDAAQVDETPRDYDAIFVHGNRRPAPFGLYMLDPYYNRRLVQFVKNELAPDVTMKDTVFLPTGGIVTDWSIARMPDTAWLNVIAQKRVAEHKPREGFENGKYAHIYKDTVSWLKSRGAKICLVTMPVSPAYRDIAQQEPQFDAAFAFFKQTAAENGAKYVSYWQAFDDPALFMNGDHLNRRGAETLTPRIILNCFGK